MTTDQPPEVKPDRVHRPLKFLAWWITLAAVVISYLSVAYPQPSPQEYFVIRVIFAMLAASLAFIVPRFLPIGTAATSIVVGGAGALSVFALVYFFSPGQLVSHSPPKETVSSLIFLFWRVRT